jgi:hypothetical protein
VEESALLATLAPCALLPWRAAAQRAGRHAICQHLPVRGRMGVRISHGDYRAGCGGGWIDSPAGAYMEDPNLTRKATFGFVSRYQKGASVPTGNTEFQFQAGGFNFHSTTCEWLLISKGGLTAQFKGSGTVNGALDPNDNVYKFMLWAGDGSPDTFRLRIGWEDPDAVEHDVYDNGASQPIGGGSIVVHTSK